VPSEAGTGATGNPAGAEPSSVEITYVGHATVLVELDGVRILTDPILRRRVVHLRMLHEPPAPSLLGRIDAVVVSHAHRDHLDVRSLRRLDPRVRVVAAAAALPSLRRRGFGRPVDAVEAGDAVAIRGVDVCATPALHGRPGSAVGFLLRGSSTVYFAGDTDVFPEMAELADPLDVALLPVWGWGPTLGAGHLDPERAVEAALLLRPRVVVPIHWGTLHPLGMSGRPFLTEPPLVFARLARERLPGVEIRVLRPRERAVLPVVRAAPR
jgi:L-ascorbate metabolism protein UlaG (beta-lactamase superfamily)